MTPERLQKYMAKAGVASRRRSEEIIAAGRVRVNGRIVREPGCKVSEADRVEVDGVVIARRSGFDYFILHKPVGILSTARDDRGRRTVLDLLDGALRDRRLYPVGRLDFATSGLIILSNDGELTHKLTHPRFGVAKTYLARTPVAATPEQLRRLAAGVLLEDGRTAPARVRLLPGGGSVPRLEITIGEGRNRQVRRMLAAVGLETSGLHRIAFGPLTLERGLAPGEYRPLRTEEIMALRQAAAGRGN
ncbi:MAG: rRNA pseudouridine synthase [Gracilibacteraceae bacterium]|jgi:23S rRNA pseudouridine2605 synthase|nr:rRNA pseudouridine synthase [Gracilibacteraceae bacterium]